MILYFKEDCYYLQGFENEYRRGISYIYNEENDSYFSSREQLIIHKNYRIEIHYNKTVENLECYFEFYDKID